MTHPHGYETSTQFSNQVAYVNINSWRAPIDEAIYLELFPTKLFDGERAASTFSPASARKFAAALIELADIYESHQKECVA